MCLSFQPLQADSLSCFFQEQLLSSSHLPKYLHLEQIILLVDMFLHRLPFALCTWLTSRKRLKKPQPPRSLSCQYTSQVHRWVQGVIYSCLGKPDGKNSTGTKNANIYLSRSSDFFLSMELRQTLPKCGWVGQISQIKDWGRKPNSTWPNFSPWRIALPVQKRGWKHLGVPPPSAFTQNLI